MQSVLDGQRARMEEKLNRPAGGGGGTDGDAYRQRLQAQLKDLEGINLEDLLREITSTSMDTVPLLPAGWRIDHGFRSEGAIGVVMRLQSPSGDLFYIKFDPEAGQYEHPYQSILQGLGNRDGIKVPALLRNTGMQDQRYFVLGQGGADGMSGDVTMFIHAFGHKGRERGNWVSQCQSIMHVNLEDLNLRNEDDVVDLFLMNVLGGNTDRHLKNYLFGRDADGYGFIVPIDHGRVFDNGTEYGWATPYEAARGGLPGWNPNQLLRAFVQRMQKDRVSAAKAYDDTLKRLRASVLEYERQNPGHGLTPELLSRLDWLEQNRESFIADLAALFPGGKP
jgi:hypothetical protein